MLRKKTIMKRNLIYLALLTIGAISFDNAYSQKDDRPLIIIIQPHICFPVGEIKKTNGVELGGHLSIETMLGTKSRLLFQFGGGLLQGKTDNDPSLPYPGDFPAITVMQLRAGGKYFLTDGLFLAGLAGGAQSFRQGDKSFGFSFAPVLGYEFGNVRLLDFSLRYDNSMFKNYNLRTIALSLGYHF